MQRGQRNVLQCRRDVRSIRYDDIASRLRDVTVSDRLIECVIRGAHERDYVTYQAAEKPLMRWLVVFQGGSLGVKGGEPLQCRAWTAADDGQQVWQVMEQAR